MNNQLPEQVVKRIKEEVERLIPTPTREVNQSDKEWDEIIGMAGEQRLSYELGLRSEAKRSQILIEALEEMIRCSPQNYEKNLLESPVTFNEYHKAFENAKQALTSYNNQT